MQGQVPVFPFPQGMAEAFAFLCYSAMVAALGPAEAAGNRTIDEGAGIPTTESHVLSYKAANWIFNVIREQHIVLEEKGIAEEEKLLETEIKAIVDKVLEIGDGDIAVGTIKAVDLGIIDNPFCPNMHLKGKALGIRDYNGLCRYLDFGNLPLPSEVKEFHRQKVAERAEKEGRKMDYDVLIQDLWAFSEGHIKGLPDK
jgi:methylaspartate mutase epsilon subunit